LWMQIHRSDATGAFMELKDAALERNDNGCACQLRVTAPYGCPVDTIVF
jgi:hypothetical protein